MKKPYLITWCDGYERFETYKELKDFCDYRGISHMSYVFRDEHYNSKNEEYRIDSKGTGRWYNLVVIYKPEIISVTVYYDTVKADYDETKDGENLIDVRMPKDKLYEWFKENVLESFRPDIDEGVSDEGLFEEWLDEYTADDTMNLVADMKQFITVPEK